MLIEGVPHISNIDGTVILLHGHTSLDIYHIEVKIRVNYFYFSLCFLYKVVPGTSCGLLNIVK